MTLWFQARLSIFGSWLQRLSAPAYALMAVGGALLLSLLFFAPKLQLWDLRHGDHYEVARAQSFLAQVERPWRHDIEAAMQWRLLPPLVAHALGLHGRAALLLPWLGVGVLLGTCTFLLRRSGLARPATLYATALLATSSAVLVPTGWLGLNDAWVWAALAGVTLGRGLGSVVGLTLLTPWVDERFIIGLPLALAVRLDLADATLRRGPVLAAAVLALLPYGALRLFLGNRLGWDTGDGFALGALMASVGWLPFAPLGWWMAWRAGWIPLGAAVIGQGGRGWRLGLLALGTLLVMAVLAVDLSRSAAILLPLALAGCLRLAAADPARGEARLAGLLALNLLLPAAHVVRVTTDLISPLPLEIFRLLRHLAS
jgi:hypothetical protein